MTDLRVVVDGILALVATHTAHLHTAQHVEPVYGIATTTVDRIMVTMLSRPRPLNACQHERQGQGVISPCSRRTAWRHRRGCLRHQ